MRSVHHPVRQQTMIQNLMCKLLLFFSSVHLPVLIGVRQWASQVRLQPLQKQQTQKLQSRGDYCLLQKSDTKCGSGRVSDCDKAKSFWFNVRTRGFNHRLVFVAENSEVFDQFFCHKSCDVLLSCDFIFDNWCQQLYHLAKWSTCSGKWGLQRAFMGKWKHKRTAEVMVGWFTPGSDVVGRKKSLTFSLWHLLLVRIESEDTV